MTTNLVFLASPQINAQKHLPTLAKKIYEIRFVPGPQQTISSLMKYVEEKQQSLQEALKICTKLYREVIEQNMQKFVETESYLSLEIKAIQGRQTRSPASDSLSTSPSGQARQSTIQRTPGQMPRQFVDYTYDAKYTTYHRLLQLKKQYETANSALLGQRSAEKLLEAYPMLKRITPENEAILQAAAVIVGLQHLKQFQARFDALPAGVPDTLQELGRDGQCVAFGCILFKPEIADFRTDTERDFQALVKLYDPAAVQTPDSQIFDQFNTAQKAYVDHLLVSSSAVLRMTSQRAYDRCIAETALRFGAECQNVLCMVLSAKEIIQLKKDLKTAFQDELLSGGELYDDGDDGFLPYVLVSCCVWG